MEAKINNDSVIKLMRTQRTNYSYQQKFHYLTFASYSLLLLLDFLIIIYTRVQTLNAYAWAGIIFLFVLMAIEAKQYLYFKNEKENIDTFYLRGEYAKLKK